MSKLTGQASKLSSGSNIPVQTKRCKPGEKGRCAVFTCPVCGNRFVRTAENQSKCDVCLENEKKKI